MVTGIDLRPGSDQGLKPYRMSVKQFERLIAAGAFPDRVRLELLGGVLFRKMTKNDPHDFTVGLLGAILNRLLEPAWFAREEKSVCSGSSGVPSRMSPSFEDRASAIAIARRGPTIWACDRSLRCDLHQRPGRQVAQVCGGRYWYLLDRQPGSKAHRGLQPAVGPGTGGGFPGRQVLRD